MRKTLLTTLLLSTLITPHTYAAKLPKDGVVDARIKTLPYRENEVFRLTGHYGYSTVLEFAHGENIETISIGDSESWQIVKPKRGNLLLIKPLEEDAQTNMTVVTDQRIYTFEMNAYITASHRSPDLSYRIKFSYPGFTDLSLADMPAASKPAEKKASPSDNILAKTSLDQLNFDYAYSGEENLRPLRAFDDGKFTYFQFADINRTPAIFSVDQAGNEALINYSHKGQYIVVESLARQFTFRDGQAHTCIFNQAFPFLDYDSLAPRHVESSQSTLDKKHATHIASSADKPARVHKKIQPGRI